MAIHSTENVQLSEKYALTLIEATQYFGIGEKKLRQLADEHAGYSDGFILKNGNKVLFKRERFAHFLDRTEAI